MRHFTYIISLCIAISVCIFASSPMRNMHFDTTAQNMLLKMLRTSPVRAKLVDTDLDAYAQQENISPDQILENMYYSKLTSEHIKRYVAYRIARRLQNRFVPINDVSRASELPCPDVYYYRFLYFFNNHWDDNATLIDNIVRHFIPGGIHVQGDMYDIGFYVHKDDRWYTPSSIYLTDAFTRVMDPDILRVVEHEITHAEQACSGTQKDDALYHSDAFQAPNFDSHKEFEAEHEAVAFHPLVYIAQQNYAKAPREGASFQEHIQYPQSEWMCELMNPRVQHISKKEMDRQQKLHERYGLRGASKKEVERVSAAPHCPLN